MEKMIQANKDPDILIKETDQEFVHVKLTKVTVIPGKEQFPRTDFEVKCYKPEVFKKLEDLRYDTKSPMVWYKIGGFTEAIVIHDPVLWAKQKREKTEAESEAEKKEKERITAELKEKEDADYELKKAARAERDQKKRDERKLDKKANAKAAAIVKRGQGTA